MERRDFAWTLSAPRETLRASVLFRQSNGRDDELIFDGNSFAVDGQGDVNTQAKSFTGRLGYRGRPRQGKTPNGRIRLNIEQVHDALVLVFGLCRKCGFKKVVLGLSGGIDSERHGALAVRALEKRMCWGHDAFSFLFQRKY